MSASLTSTPRSGAPLRNAARRLAAAAGFALLLLASAAPLLAVADLPGAARGTLAAVFPPGVDRAEALAGAVAAGGLVVREGGWGTVVVAHSDAAGFAGRLRRAGAWLVLDPQSAAGCLVAGRLNAGF
ncbi:MAG TPA: hypothetical protein VKP12_01555 [Kiloniellaceae bacterium]|nr:hypothetical protein [Kiloniellaceae bacterium]